MHLDMDAFFASVEEREHPEFKGKPIVVGANPKNGTGRGVVSTCNYSAREFGIKSAMPISKAWKLCPDAIFLPVNFKLYSEVSENIMEILKNHASKFEQTGIDEAFLDITDWARNLENAKDIAEVIKKEIFEKERLTCSIGIGPNKLVAKIASDFQKPDGLTVVKEEDAKKFLSALPVRKLIGVGPKSEERLNRMGIKTIGDLAETNPEKLLKEFGSWGLGYLRAANGIDESEIRECWTPKSIGREITFEEDTKDPKLISKTIDKVSEEIHGEILMNKFLFKTVTVKIRYEDFETHGHSRTLIHHTSKKEDIILNAYDLTSKFLGDKRKIRLIGVKVSNFISSEKQKTLAKLK